MLQVGKTPVLKPCFLNLAPNIGCRVMNLDFPGVDTIFKTYRVKPT